MNNLHPQKRKARRSKSLETVEVENEDSYQKELLKKPKRNSYSFEEKTNIFKMLSTDNINVVSQQFSVDVGLLNKWKRNRSTIEKFAEKSDSKNKKKNRSNNKDLDDTLYNWMIKARSDGIVISGPILCAKALAFNKEIGGNEKFKASSGWLEGWKDRKNVRWVKISGEKKSADTEGAKQYKDVFSKLIKSKGLTRQQVFNFDETGLVYKDMPDKTFASTDEVQVSGFKKKKERVSVGFCCTADGSMKMPLLVIGKSKNPRKLKNLQKSKLPVVYDHQNNAWMDKRIFRDWVNNKFVPEVSTFLKNQNLPLKALLLVDNFSGHEFIRVGEIEVAFLPPNVTSILQPLDQGIIEMTKRHYKSKFAFSFVTSQAKEISVEQQLKNISIIDVIYWISEAWNVVPLSTIYRCWNKLWPVETKDVAIQTDSTENDSVITQLDMINIGESHNSLTIECEGAKVHDIMQLLKNIKGYEMVNERDVVSWLEKNDIWADNKELTEDEIVAQVSALDTFSDEVNHLPSEDNSLCQSSDDSNNVLVS